MATSVLAGIASEETQLTIKAVLESQQAIQKSLDDLSETMLMLMSQILAQQPRLDASNRVAVNVETGVVQAVVNSGAINISNYAVGNAAPMPFNFSDAGATTIYDNLVIS